MLEEFGPDLYVADGPTVSFFGFPYPTRMALARLEDGGVWVWSPVALTDELVAAVEAIGPVRHIVSPNKLHWLYLSAWASRWPEVRLYAPPGLAKKLPQLRFDAELNDEPVPAWAGEIDQALFGGSFAMTEVVFFHRRSRTVIVGDLIQRHPRSAGRGWRGILMRLDGLIGERGSTPREWRATFLRRESTRRARDRVLGWNADQLLIAHGACVRSGASAVIDDALRWI